LAHPAGPARWRVWLQQPVPEPVPESVHEPVPEPVHESVPEPVRQPVPEPIPVPQNGQRRLRLLAGIAYNRGNFLRGLQPWLQASCAFYHDRRKSAMHWTTRRGFIFEASGLVPLFFSSMARAQADERTIDKLVETALKTWEVPG